MKFFFPLMVCYFYCCPVQKAKAQSCNIDSVLAYCTKRHHSIDESSIKLISSLSHYRNIAAENIIRIKIYYGTKELTKVEHQYRITQREVNKYIDTMIFYIADPDYIYNYERFNKQLEVAMFSIKDLCDLFNKYDYYDSLYATRNPVIKKSAIHKLIKESAKWRGSFGDGKRGVQYKLLPRKYWYDWEDKLLNGGLPKRKRVSRPVKYS